MELEKLKRELADAEAVAAEKAKAENAEAEALAAARAAVEAETKRLNSTEYKNALKKIDELANDAEARKMAIHKTVDGLWAELQAWQDVCNQHRRLCNQHRIENTKDLLGSETAYIGNLSELAQRLKPWLDNVRYIEAIRNPKPDVKPVQKKSLFGSSEREKMLKRRYPEPK